MILELFVGSRFGAKNVENPAFEQQLEEFLFNLIVLLPKCALRELNNDENDGGLFKNSVYRRSGLVKNKTNLPLLREGYWVPRATFWWLGRVPRKLQNFKDFRTPHKSQVRQNRKVITRFWGPLKAIRRSPICDLKLQNTKRKIVPYPRSRVPR